MNIALIVLAVLVLVCGAVFFTYKNRAKIDQTVADAEAKAKEVQDKINAVKDSLTK